MKFDTMNSGRTLVAISVLALFGHAVSLGQEDSSLQKLIEESKSVDSDEIKAAVADLKKAIDEMEKNFNDAISLCRTALFDRLERERLKATKEGKLVLVVKIRELEKLAKTIQFLPPSNRSHPNDKPTKESLLAKSVGKWKGTYGTTGNECYLEVDKKGNVINEAEKLELVFRSGRLLAVGSTKFQNIEIVPTGDRVIVLGWPVNGKSKNILSDQPTHVAILKRVYSRKANR